MRFSISIRSRSSAARLSSYCSVFTRNSSSNRFRSTSPFFELSSSSLTFLSRASTSAFDFIPLSIGLKRINSRYHGHNLNVVHCRTFL
ncbi:unnamed protein product [Haemonchus placei]|uniref:Uncharacterized protein n=1 Tax=Haemonchus placei TaxID=6290 RepID=A0A3P7X135_HAEPC|nr:unnamed protein product [Haemonchus placei]